MKVSLKCIVFSLLLGPVAGAQVTKNDLEPFKKALDQFRAAKYDQAIPALQDILKEKTTLEEYVRFYLAQSYMKTSKWDDAEGELKKVLDLSPNVKMSIEASNLMGQIALEKKNYKLASTQFVKLEKRTRNTEDYPDVIYNLAIAEKGLNRHGQMCKWLVKLYERYPAYPKVADWSVDLAINEFEGKPTDCKVTPEDFRTRVRYLLWAGLDQKAQGEINIMKSKVAKSDKYLADKLQAQFYLQEGEVTKAVELLKPYYEANKRNFDFLILFASSAARAGEVQLAVGSYYSAYKLSPKSKTGRQALYQSAFLSYQFQDYDGAARRFQEFMKAYPSSGLNRDAQWHLAWLKYLKGDYQGAYKALGNLNAAKKKNRKAWKSFPEDRVTYWMAMSLFRQGKVEQAKAMMSSLAKDPLLGYYSIAAQSRLKKMEEIKVPRLAESSLPTQPRVISRFSAGEFLMPYSSDSYRGDDSESEETLVLTQYSADDEKGEEEEAEAADNPDLKSVEVATSEDEVPDASGEKVTTFSNPALMKRFERARDMMILGENEWARWDLYDIERKTSNREYLRTLMSEYNTAGHYNRSSYIAQINFGGQRAAHGVEGIRYLWEFAYPRAYSEHVEKYTKKFAVPEELVWGIMRAETHYRRDAISPVGALGLMQVMPFTGHKVATLLGEKEFKAPLLLQPETSVKIGSRYLKRLMDRFENTIPLVAAGYNAGPHRVKNWLSSFGNLETDEFIEHIPFLETRNYVKRVVSNAYIYSQLYGNKKDLFPYMAGAVPVKFQAELAGKENWDDI
ncbi:Cell division coordinator CpoB [Bdellovibrio bacteriovorus]|uniref:transglycosylase SLT domain-containing protein n=1 Tax=Bdellovibrio bacteriovorus TaxID=959 RepID=UPI00045BF556|nr:transglycosylase SLT domain-containing protein [Bdellovibrio bacteriovorus]AHZ85211.1 lytic murein transglycosylase [Bdellovibrio bacteriovorus]BEV69103.1 Cell division coordinator CpoB [Bdellovibrio bacteriovorus]